MNTNLQQALMELAKALTALVNVFVKAAEKEAAEKQNSGSGV